MIIICMANDNSPRDHLQIDPNLFTFPIDINAITEIANNENVQRNGQIRAAEFERLYHILDNQTFKEILISVKL